MKAAKKCLRRRFNDRYFLGFITSRYPTAAKPVNSGIAFFPRKDTNFKEKKKKKNFLAKILSTNPNYRCPPCLK